MRMPDYQASIVNVSASLMKHYQLTSSLTPLPLLDEQLKKNYRHVVLMLFDGLGVNVLKRHLSPDAFLNKNLKMTLTSVFPSTTVAATMAVLTGKSPCENGLIGWFQYVEKEDVYYTVFLKKDYYNQEKIIPETLHPLFERQTFLDRINAGDTGTKAQIFYPYPVDKKGFTTTQEGLERLSAYQQAHPQTFSYFYVTEPDLSSHKHGISSDVVKDKVIAINDALEDYAKTLPSDTLILVIADHGLCDVLPLPLMKNEALISTFKHLPAIEPRATTFYIKDGQKALFEELFNASYRQWFSLYDKDTFLKSGWLGPGKCHPLTKSSLGDYISIGIDKYYFSLDESYIFKGHHAGMTRDEMDVPLVIIEGGTHR